jgi:DNA topoisomerase-1
VKPLRVLGAHPDGGEVAIYEGRYGPYAKWEKVNATIPKEIAPEAVTLEQALELIAAKPAGRKRPAPRKKPAAKPAKAKTTKARPAKKKTAGGPPTAG